MSLLPSRDPAVPDADPRVIAVDSEDADDVLSALSASTARNLLAALHEEPAPPGELATRVDTSLQNAQYHIEKLKTAGAVEVVDTAYSEKGREMDVYAPSNQPLVICAGDEADTSGLRSALANLVGSVAILGFVSVLVQLVLGGDGALASGTTGTMSPSVSLAPNGTGEVAPAIPDGGEIVFDGAAQLAGATALEPGLLFFAGGAVMLATVVAIRRYW